MGFNFKKQFRKVVGKKIGKAVSKVVNTDTVSYVFPLQSFYTKAQRKTPVGAVVTGSLLAGGAYLGGSALAGSAGSLLTDFESDGTLPATGEAFDPNSSPSYAQAGGPDSTWYLVAAVVGVIAIYYYLGKRK